VNRNEWVRQAHRWLSITFTVAVVANIVLNLVARDQKVTLWVGLLTLLPLALLLVTGLYLFVLPYATRRRSGWRTD
jgi:L-asparagine transporter-like permease